MKRHLLIRNERLDRHHAEWLRGWCNGKLFPDAVMKRMNENAGVWCLRCTRELERRGYSE